MLDKLNKILSQDEDSDHEDMKKRVPSAPPGGGRKLGSGGKQRRSSAISNSSKGSSAPIVTSPGPATVDLNLNTSV